jgi:AsmA protein
MQEIDTIPAPLPEGTDDPSEPEVRYERRGPFHWRFLLIYLILIGFALLALVPPLVNVGRFKRRIVTSISTSIGRPVHLDNVSLVLLPFPGFKLENFVVAEDPAFGAEPVIHANNVVATLRVSSLWRRKVEFSKISLEEPSINLVHMSAGTPNAGHWNVESILLQAAHIPAAPTAQAKAGPDPRFPYIEATDARVNIKFGDEKLPLSLTEADFSLWLPRPQQWRIRLEGKPTRTDTSASDTGTLSLEGTLDRAERFDLIPIDLAGEWKNAPLGEASRVLTGRDAGVRGDLKLNVSAHGTIGDALVRASLQLRGARRADFVPPEALDLRAECQATAANRFHALHGIRCSWPPAAGPSMLALTGDMPNIHQPGNATFELGTPGLRAATLLQWLRIASPRVSPDVVASGTLTGSVTREATSGVSGRGVSGRFLLRSAALTGGPLGDASIVLGDASIATAAPQAPSESSRRRVRSRARESAAAPPPDGTFVMLPATLALGGKEPATLEGRFDANGYTLHLVGSVLPSRLRALAIAIPQFGDGLSAMLPAPPPLAASSPGSQNRESPIRLDVASARLWGGGQSWSKTIAKAPKASTVGHRRRAHLP